MSEPDAQETLEAIQEGLEALDVQEAALKKRIQKLAKEAEAAIRRTERREARRTTGEPPKEPADRTTGLFPVDPAILADGQYLSAQLTGLEDPLLAHPLFRDSLAVPVPGGLGALATGVIGLIPKNGGPTYNQDQEAD